MSNATREADRVAMMVAEMDSKTQNEFFERLVATGELTDEEIKSMKIAVAYIKMYTNPDLLKALKEEMGKRLYEEFNQ